MGRLEDGRRVDERLAAADRAQLRMLAGAAAATFLAIATLWPQTAWAWAWDEFDPIGSMLDAVSTAVFVPLITGTTGFVAECAKAISELTIIGAAANTDWDMLMQPVWDVLSIAQDSVVTPVAMQILTLVMMFRLLGISRIAESQDMQPLAAKVAVTLVGYFFMMFLVQHASAILTVGWDLFRHMITEISTASSMSWGSFASISQEQIEAITPGLDGLILILAGSVLLVIVLAIAYVVAVVMYYSKIIKLYLHAFFAPLGLSFFGLDATRQWGLGYVKSVAANLLSLVIVFVTLRLFPYMISSVMALKGAGDAAGDGNLLACLLDLAGPSLDGLSGITDLLVLIVLFVLLIGFLVRSSAVAKEILGG